MRFSEYPIELIVVCVCFDGNMSSLRGSIQV